MSADNGIYILETMTSSGPLGNEYRVAECANIDDCDESDLMLVVKFGQSEVYKTFDEAQAKALELEEKAEYTEYGICCVIRNFQFPNISVQDAKKALRIVDDEHVVDAFWAIVDSRTNRPDEDGEPNDLINEVVSHWLIEDDEKLKTLFEAAGYKVEVDGASLDHDSYCIQVKFLNEVPNVG